MYTLKDKTDILKSKKVAIIGYGNQGRPQALNLMDSGILPKIGLRAGSSSIDVVKKDGLEVELLPDLISDNDVFIVLIPDEAQGDFFEKYVYDYIKEGQTYIFAHGFSVHFNQVNLDKFPVNIGLIAPKGPGTALRKRYLSGEGLPGIFAIHKDYTGELKDILLSYGYFSGMLKKGLYETTFREEVITDLFGEQVALCGGTVQLMKQAFNTLVEDGFSPEMAYFETVFEMKAIIDMIYEKGIAYMREKISDTAEFGAYDFVETMDNDRTKKLLKERLEFIKSGKFAEKWVREYKIGKTNLYKKRDEEKESIICKIEKMMRDKGML